jgi:ABC-type phosphate transport system ATPase subunit
MFGLEIMTAQAIKLMLGLRNEPAKSLDQRSSGEIEELIDRMAYNRMVWTTPLQLPKTCISCGSATQPCCGH